MAQKVQIDYAHDYDFDSIETFQYVDTEESNVKGNQMMADRVASMIKTIRGTGYRFSPRGG